LNTHCTWTSLPLLSRGSARGERRAKRGKSEEKDLEEATNSALASAGEVTLERIGARVLEGDGISMVGPHAF